MVDADPEIVTRAVETVRCVDEKISVLCGAGINDAGDVAKALSLGTQGVLISSGIVKARHVEETLRSLAVEFQSKH